MSIPPNFGEPPPNFSIPPPNQNASRSAQHGIPNFNIPPPVNPRSIHPSPGVFFPTPANHPHPSTNQTSVPPPGINYPAIYYPPPMPNYSTPPPPPAYASYYDGTTNFTHPPPSYAPAIPYMSVPPPIPYQPRAVQEYRPRSTQSQTSNFRYQKPRFNASTKQYNQNESYKQRQRSNPTTIRSKSEPYSDERRELLMNWRKNYCETSEDIRRKLEEMNQDEKNEIWIRSSPAELFYTRKDLNEVVSTSRLDSLCLLFEEELIKRSAKVKSTQTPYNPPAPKRRHRVCKHKCTKKKKIFFFYFLLILFFFFFY